MSPGSRRILPPLSALVAFERAAARRSFKLAARDLALSPSAISHQVRNLEDRLGVQLFMRKAGPIRLTAEGEVYSEAVARHLRGLEDATRALLDAQDDLAWDLRVGVTPFFSSAVLIPALLELRGDDRVGKLHLETFPPDGDFETSGLDVLIRLGRAGLAGLKLFPLLDVHRMPVCSPEIARKLSSPEDLREHVLIHIMRQPDAWRTCLEDLGVAGLSGASDLWVDSVPAALEAAENGLGVCLAMSPLVQGQSRFGRTLVAPFPNVSTRPQTFFLACRPERSEERPILALRNWVSRAVERAVRDRGADVLQAAS